MRTARWRRRPYSGRPLKQIPRQIDAWFDDHFGLRNSLVSLHGAVDYAIGVSSSKDVVLGRDGWLFYAADRIIESRRGVIPFSEDELRTWQRRLEERRDWLAARGTHYVFVLAPEKSTIYPELLPPRLQPGSAPTRADQLFAWLHAHSTLDALDLREALSAAKTGEQVYYRTDTHWNNVGGFVAYRQLAERLHARFPELRPLEPAELERRVFQMGGDLAGMLALQPYLSEDYVGLFPEPDACEEQAITEAMKLHPEDQAGIFACPHGELGRALIVHDSFFLAIRPFFRRHFRRSTFVRSAFRPEIVAEEHPDVVIEEMVERMLSRPGFVPRPELAEFDDAHSR